MKVRQHRGGLDSSMATVAEIEPTLEALTKHINDRLSPFKPWDVGTTDLTFCHQGFDHRIGWDTWLIKVNGYGIFGMLDLPWQERTYPGKQLFELKATHGLPLDVAVERILVQEGRSIDWIGFVEQARSNGWYDFQTLEVVTQALEDAFVPRATQAAILLRLKQYILNNLLPF